mgnify:CR=1 FL=1
MTPADQIQGLLRLRTLPAASVCTDTSPDAFLSLRFTVSPTFFGRCSLRAFALAPATAEAARQTITAMRRTMGMTVGLIVSWEK